MDDLHRKLDQILAHSFEGSCPTCRMCTHHSRQQEATSSQLSAQAKILENLERNVMDLKNALEELTQSRFPDKIQRSLFGFPFQFHSIIHVLYN